MAQVLSVAQVLSPSNLESKLAPSTSWLNVFSRSSSPMRSCSCSTSYSTGRTTSSGPWATSEYPNIVVLCKKVHGTKVVTWVGFSVVDPVPFNRSRIRGSGPILRESDSESVLIITYTIYI